MEEDTTKRLSETLRIGGYLVAGGALLGFSVGVYMLFNRALLSFVIRISQFEVVGYFFSVSVSSFAVLLVIGYLFVTTSGLKRTDPSNVLPLCALSLVCMVLSALSIFYLICFFGGLLTLTALMKAYAKPTFEILSVGEAFLLVEVGAIFVAFFSLLFFLMRLISSFFQTYEMGLYGSYSPYALLLVGVISFLKFFVILLWGSRSTDVRLPGAFGPAMSVLFFLFVFQNQYVFVNAPAYIGVIMLVLGSILTVIGDIVYVKLSFSGVETEPTTVRDFSLLYRGRYCPHCGRRRSATFQNLCSHCGRSLMWTPDAPFCPSCGRLVPTSAQTCPHCQEDIENKRSYFDQRDAGEAAPADKLTTESMRKQGGIIRELLRFLKRSDS